MKTFEHEERTYSIQNGLLYKKYGSTWGYECYISDGKLKRKAINNGWKGNAGINLWKRRRRKERELFNINIKNK